MIEAYAPRFGESAPINRSEDEWKERCKSAEAPDAEREDRARFKQTQAIGNSDDCYDKRAGDEDLRSVVVAVVAAVVANDVGTKHRAQA